MRRFADFRGRCTRREVAAWYIVTMVGSFLVKAASRAIAPGAEFVADLLFWLALLCPTCALFVRRLHDSGRSGWWSLLLLPALINGHYEMWMAAVTGQAYVPDLITGWWLAAAGIMLIAFFGLLLIDGSPQDNRWGPNPRNNAPESD
ncbi:MAG TPA: DUF805 domain-containing protein [Allosphingosinicella sp.]